MGIEFVVPIKVSTRYLAVIPSLRFALEGRVDIANSLYDLFLALFRDIMRARIVNYS